MPIGVDQIIARLEWAAAQGLAECSVTLGGVRIDIRRQVSAAGGAPTPAGPASGAAVAVPAGEGPAEGAAIVAPLSGLCLLAPAPGAAPFVQPGDAVAAGQTVCLIEAMKVVTAVAAPAAGTVDRVLVADGEVVEAGAVLLRLRA